MVFNFYKYGDLSKQPVLHTVKLLHTYNRYISRLSRVPFVCMDTGLSVCFWPLLSTEQEWKSH